MEIVILILFGLAVVNGVSYWFARKPISLFACGYVLGVLSLILGALIEG